MIVSENGGDPEAAAVHNEIYGARRGRTTPWENKSSRKGTHAEGGGCSGSGITEQRARSAEGKGYSGDGCVTLQPSVTCQWGIHDSGDGRAVTKGGGRTERGESLGDRGGVAEGARWSARRESCDWARWARAWRRVGRALPTTSRGRGPLVPIPSVTVGICVTSMTQLWGLTNLGTSPPWGYRGSSLQQLG